MTPASGTTGPTASTASTVSTTSAASAASTVSAASGAPAGAAAPAGRTDGSVQILLPGDGWLTVCELSRLLPGRGVAALLPDGSQAAVFQDRAGRLYAIDNRDPFNGAAVLARGLTGSHDGRPFVASPLLKQRFDLASGVCLDDDSVSVTTYQVRTV